MKYSAVAEVDSGPSTPQVSAAQLDPKTAEALREFAKALESCKSADDIQGLAFESIRRSGTKPSDFFSAVYRILLGTERGPKLGPYVMDAGPAVIARKLREASEPKG